MTLAAAAIKEKSAGSVGSSETITRCGSVGLVAPFLGLAKRWFKRSTEKTITKWSKQLKNKIKSAEDPSMLMSDLLDPFLLPSWGCPLLCYCDRIVSDWIGSRLDYNNYNRLRAIHQITATTIRCCTSDTDTFTETDANRYVKRTHIDSWGQLQWYFS